MVSQMFLAQALLVLHADQVHRAEVTTRAHAHAQAEVDPLLANWAWADNAKRSPSMIEAGRWMGSGHDHRIVTLSGPNGRGKTVAACRWLGRQSAVFIRGATLGREDWTGGAVLRRALSARCLVIDNLGEERARAREHVTSLITEGHDAGRRILITTTLTLGSLETDKGTIAAEYPSSVHSRLSAGFVDVDGDDLRSDAQPILDGLADARALARVVLTCRNMASLPEHARAASVQSLAALLGADPGSPEVIARADQIAARWAAEVRGLEDFTRTMAREAAAIADARGSR